jgi:DNA-binding transcriptional ArsR family regulator
VIDRLRREIEQRLEQVLNEAAKLRQALAALDPRAQASPPRKASARPAARARRHSQAQARAGRRTPPGATKAKVLAALSDGKAMTAGEVAAATGLGRPTVSTTLSKLAKSGEVRKADRGYALPGSRRAGGTREGA